MRVNALVVDLGLLGPARVGVPRARHGRPARHGRGGLHRPYERLAAGARPARRRRRLGHEALPPGGGAGARRGRGAAPQARFRARRHGPARGRRARDPRRPVPGVRRQPQRRPHPPRVRGAPAARPGRGQGAPARGDLPGGLGLRDGPRRPLGGRVRAQGAPEARDRPRRTGATSTRTSAWATASSRSGPGGPDEAAAFEAELQAAGIASEPSREHLSGGASLSHTAAACPGTSGLGCSWRAVVVVVAIVIAVARAGMTTTATAQTTTRSIGRTGTETSTASTATASRRPSRSTLRAASRWAACRTSR